MTTWYAKAAIQGTMSLLPDPQRANRVFQRAVTGRLHLSPEFFDKKLQVAQRHLSNFETATGDQLPGSVVELGTGWHPVVPIEFALRGVPSVSTVDLAPLFDDQEIRETLHAFAARVAASNGYPRGSADRIRRALALDTDDACERLEAVGVVSMTADASTLERSEPLDLFTSNNTLEHIPGPAIGQILARFRLLSHDDTVASHLIDLADHYAGFDRSITPYHFLRFSERQWSMFNNSLQFQNRLRHSQYLELFDAAGWSSFSVSTDGDPELLATVPVHEDFHGLSAEDLAVHTSWLVHRVDRRKTLTNRS